MFSRPCIGAPHAKRDISGEEGGGEERWEITMEGRLNSSSRRPFVFHPPPRITGLLLLKVLIILRFTPLGELFVKSLFDIGNCMEIDVPLFMLVPAA